MAVTQYADAFTNAASTTFNITLNSTAISDANTEADVTNGRLYIALLHSNDFEANETLLNTPETTGGLIVNLDGGQFISSENSGTGSDPALTIGHTDGSSDTIYAEGSGNDDDGHLLSTNTSGDGLAARNVSTGTGNFDGSAFVYVGHSKVAWFSLDNRIVYRAWLAFDVTGSSSKTINSLSLKLVSKANLAGFTKSAWTGETYICKTTHDPGNNLMSNAFFNALDGWASSGTYEAAVAAPTENATFFGTNF